MSESEEDKSKENVASEAKGDAPSDSSDDKAAKPQAQGGAGAGIDIDAIGEKIVKILKDGMAIVEEQKQKEYGKKLKGYFDKVKSTCSDVAEKAKEAKEAKEATVAKSSDKKSDDTPEKKD